MTRRVVASAAVIAAVIGLALTSQASSAERTITVAAAASFTDVLPQIAEQFHVQHPDATVRFTFGGSPSLVEQVLAEAPIDVILTASQSTMDKAVRADVVDRPRAVARNRLAIVVPAGNPAEVGAIADIANPGVTTVICAPSVPCGEATATLLARNDVMLVPASLELDVRSALSKVMADQADAAVVYVTDARVGGPTVQTISIPSDRNVITTAEVALVRATRDRETAQAFIDLVTGPLGVKFLIAAGFEPPSAR